MRWLASLLLLSASCIDVADGGASSDDLTSLEGDEYTIEWELLMAATAVAIIPLLIVFFCAQRYFVEGIVTTGIKG